MYCIYVHIIKHQMNIKLQKIADYNIRYFETTIAGIYPVYSLTTRWQFEIEIH